MKIAVFWVVAPCSLVEVNQLTMSVIALMMEAARTSETLVNFYQTTRCYNPEDSNLRTFPRNTFALCFTDLSLTWQILLVSVFWTLSIVIVFFFQNHYVSTNGCSPVLNRPRPIYMYYKKFYQHSNISS
jgi:hypothetical protein